MECLIQSVWSLIILFHQLIYWDKLWLRFVCFVCSLMFLPKEVLAVNFISQPLWDRHFPTSDSRCRWPVTLCSSLWTWSCSWTHHASFQVSLTQNVLFWLALTLVINPTSNISSRSFATDAAFCSVLVLRWVRLFPWVDALADTIFIGVIDVTIFL